MTKKYGVSSKKMKKVWLLRFALTSWLSNGQMFSVGFQKDIISIVYRENRYLNDLNTNKK